MPKKQKCAFCGGEITGKPWIGFSTGMPYCPDEAIEECLSRFATRVDYIDCTYQPAEQAV